LVFTLLLVLTLPKLPRAHVGQAAAEWDAGSYVFLVLMFMPLICIWFGVGRNKWVEALGWVLLLLLAFGELAS